MHLYILYFDVYNSLVETIFSPLNLFVMKTPPFPLKYKVQCPAEVPRGSWQGAGGCEQFQGVHCTRYLGIAKLKVSTIVKSTP
jgi:hypothetical protein